MFAGFARLRLVRPLVALDAETTGCDPRNDRIVEIAGVRYAPPPLELILNRDRISSVAVVAESFMSFRCRSTGARDLRARQETFLVHSHGGE